MTDAWGTVIAAAIAVAGSAIGFFVGRRQVQDQAQIEHAQWLRGERQEAYAAFLAAWDGAYAGMRQEASRVAEQWEMMEEHGQDFSPEPHDLDYALEVADRLMNPVRAVQERVLLLGPVVVDEVVERMGQALETLRTAFIDHLAPIVHPRPEIRWDAAVTAMERSRTEMMMVMRSEIRSAPTVGRAARARALQTGHTSM